MAFSSENVVICNRRIPVLKNAKLQKRKEKGNFGGIFIDKSHKLFVICFSWKWL